MEKLKQEYEKLMQENAVLLEECTAYVDLVITLVKGLIKCHLVVEGMDTDGGFQERVHEQIRLPLPVMIDLTGGE